MEDKRNTMGGGGEELGCYGDLIILRQAKRTCPSQGLGKARLVAVLHRRWLQQEVLAEHLMLIDAVVKGGKDRATTSTEPVNSEFLPLSEIPMKRADTSIVRCVEWRRT